MDKNTNQSPCKDGSIILDAVQLQSEVDHLRQHLAERDGHIVALEAEFLKSSKRINSLEEQLDIWREKYERLYESHKRVQKLNQVLEDKLLQMVDKMKGEKSQLTKDIATLSVRLAEAKHNYSMLQKENERYKNDMNLAIQLLQCKPDNFVSQKLDNLPADTQARVSQYVMSKTKTPSLAPSKTNNEQDTFDASEYEFNISASLMTKILEDSIQDSVTKHCDTCTCNRSNNKPFCYNDSFYSVGTQTLHSGKIYDSLCINCNSEIKPHNMVVSARNSSPIEVTSANDRHSDDSKILSPLVETSMHKISQPSTNVFADHFKIPNETDVQHDKPNVNVKESAKTAERPNAVISPDKKILPKVENSRSLKKTGSMSMEPAVHHKLCDHTKNSHSSKLSSSQSNGNDDSLIKDNINTKCSKAKSENHFGDNLSLRKNSQSSMGALSRTSSVAKSTVSTHKSGNQVGPGPRFCHLRVQAGSKNILLDNAEPDVPPVLYRRQSKGNEIFKDLNDDLDNFIDLGKTDDEIKEDVKNDNAVVETTLIDVHVDNNIKETNNSAKNSAINPVLMNVSSSPLQPLKTHTFSNSSENNNNPPRSSCSQQNTSEFDNLLSDFNHTLTNDMKNNNDNPQTYNNDIPTAPNDNEIKIFNFDVYEQSKLTGQYQRPLRKIDMSQLQSIENTKISKDLPPPHSKEKADKDFHLKPSLPAVVNVYPNLTQTHLKVNEGKKVFTNEHSTSSLSSDDSAALMQKQQLLRVAEWVEQNLEQQNNLNDPLEDEFHFNKIRGESKLTRLTETLNELALNMPHPVSKYSKTGRREANTTLVHSVTPTANNSKAESHTTDTKFVNNVIKETIFPVESGGATVTEVNNHRSVSSNVSNATKEFCDSLKPNGEKEISAEDLARMEYNVKKFLLSRPQWVNPGHVERSRRTSSKTETDV